jgi:pyrroloquinoline quinone (PQQ) biosynthesis protein C
MLQNEKLPIMAADEVAEALGLTRAVFMRRRNELAIQDGMPSPLPGKTPRWHREGMEKWVRQYGEMKTDALRTGSSLIRIHIDRRALERHYVQGAAA